MAIVVCGAFAGIGGAVLSLQELGTFTDGMTNGRGFIALAALIIGRWQPLWIMFACLLFGAASAFAFNLQGWSLPISSYVIQMTPYLLALAGPLRDRQARTYAGFHWNSFYQKLISHLFIPSPEQKL